MARVLKDLNGDIGNHLQSHVHLTNCIHLKNQMHKDSHISNVGEEAETSIRGFKRGFDRGKRRKFRSTSRTQISKAPNDDVVQNKIPVPPKTSAQNFSGQNFGSLSQEGDLVESNSSNDYDGEVRLLLVETPGSRQNTMSADWENGFSGELGVYADKLLHSKVDFEKVSEARTADQHRFREHHYNRHQNLTQKYTPKTFEDIVGQSLVSQALLNAVSKKKIGPVYVFYGPHGTGKTAMARVFARTLNCQSERQTKPCCFCNFCKAYERGKTRNIKEIASAGNLDFERMMDLLNNMTVCLSPATYKIFIFDDCDTMSRNSWSALSKVIERAPRRVVFILVCSNLQVLPRVIISRCQKFLFSNLKDADFIQALRDIANKEVLDIDDDALKIIASRSDGSLRDAEMTLEQLSLLGQRITLPLVQELVGLTTDEKLADLLDLVLSADTINTVRSLREIMESGVEPLALISQIATVITDMLAGTFDLTKERTQRKFFQGRALFREHMEKLRQALTILSKAEKQLSMSNDKTTWLIATVLKLAPDQQYTFPNSSAATNLNHGPDLQGNYATDRRREASSKNHEQSTSASSKNHEQSTSLSPDINKTSGRRISDIVYKDIEQIWSEVLEKIQVRRLKEFMYREGKIISLSFDKVPTVQLMFSSQRTKSKAEDYEASLLKAFESVLGFPLRLKIRCEDTAYPEEVKNIKKKDINTNTVVKSSEITVVGDDELTSAPEMNNLDENGQRTSLVKNRVTLAQIIQQKSNRSNCRAVSIAQELEKENLRLEPRTRSLHRRNSKGARRRHRKHSRWKIGHKKPAILIRFVTCGKCLSSMSPR